MLHFDYIRNENMYQTNFGEIILDSYPILIFNGYQTIKDKISLADKKLFVRNVFLRKEQSK